MSTPQGPRREHPSTYVVQDRSHQEEMTRLQMQDHLLTSGMGGVLADQEGPTSFRRVLDVGCGTGGWLLETAKAYPMIQLLIGVDVSKHMVDSAREQSVHQQMSDHVEFHVMDALRMLEFPTNYFDLVNERLGGSYLRTWEWPKLLNECQRVCKRGGVIRLTESGVASSNSPALTSLSQLIRETFYHAGYLFTSEDDGVTSHLAHLLYQYAGVEQVQTQPHALHYRAGTLEGQLFYDDMKQIFRTILPFLRRWTRIPDDYETTYQQMLNEMQQPDFEVTWHLLTAWGNVERK
ncbi:MAG TPA: methyltransferase domain-containing protein [Ktedonosporobacter sp.]|nr:methyltransferase domain-containing protein [Ktedonosporobacter sp.]